MLICLERTNAAAAGTMNAASRFMRTFEGTALHVCRRIDANPIEAPTGVALLDFLGEKTWQ
jgi:hypothetical protein